MREVITALYQPPSTMSYPQQTVASLAALVELLPLDIELVRFARW